MHLYVNDGNISFKRYKKIHKQHFFEKQRTSCRDAIVDGWMQHHEIDLHYRLCSHHAVHACCHRGGGGGGCHNDGVGARGHYGGGGDDS